MGRRRHPHHTAVGRSRSHNGGHLRSLLCSGGGCRAAVLDRLRSASRLKPHDRCAATTRFQLDALCRRSQTAKVPDQLPDRVACAACGRGCGRVPLDDRRSRASLARADEAVWTAASAPGGAVIHARPSSASIVENTRISLGSGSRPYQVGGSWRITLSLGRPTPLPRARKAGLRSATLSNRRH